MPFARLEVNMALAAEQSDRLLRQVSAAVASGTGKPESVVQVVVAGNAAMYMAQSDAPTAYLDVKGIGLSPERTPALSEALCGVLHRELGIPGNRVYISFASFAGNMWGFDGRTF